MDVLTYVLSRPELGAGVYLVGFFAGLVVVALLGMVSK